MTKPIAPLASDAPVALPRRSLLVLSGVAGAALAGCGSDPAPGTDAGLSDVPPTDTPAGDVPATDAPPPTDGGSSNTCANAPSPFSQTQDGVDCGGEDFGFMLPLSELPVGCTRLVDRRVPTVRVILARDAQGVWALDYNCTHTGCRLPLPRVGDNGAPVIRCPCHFSEFDIDGRVGMGSKAMRDLPNYRVRICDGGVYVNPRETVAPGTRVAVP